MQRIANFLRRFRIARRTVTLLAVLAALVTLLSVASGYVLNAARALVEEAAGEQMAVQQKLFDISVAIGNAQTQLNQFAQGLGTEAAGEIITAVGAALQQAEEIGSMSDDERLDDLASRARKFRESVDALNATIASGGALSAGHKAFINDGLSRLSEEVSQLSDTLADALRQTMQVELERSRAQQIALSVVSVGVLVAFVGISYALIRSLAPPILSIQVDAEAIAGGDLDRRVTVSGRDEISALGRAFNHMAEQLAGLIASLEVRVAERTRDLETVAEIGREAAVLRDLDELLNHAINLLCDRFGFYHAQVFLIDAIGEYAVLCASTGKAGQALLARGHKLAVGSDSVIGQVTAHGQTVVALDTEDAQVVHKPNPLLPDTRSEMALPLRIGDQIIGALDVQSVEPDAFDENDVQVFQTFADQLAIAISNARLIQETQARVREIDRLNRQLTRQAWSEFADTEGRALLGYRYDLNRVVPITDRDARDDGDGFTVPIRSRGEVIGALRAGGSAQPFGEDEQAIIEAVAERVGLAVESARLFRQTETALDESRALYQGSELLNASTNFEEILLSLIHSTALGRTERASMGLFNRPQVGEDKPEWLDIVAVWRQDGASDPLMHRRYALDEFPLLNVLNREEIVVIDDLETNPRFNDAMRDLVMSEMGIRSLVGIPFLIGDEWIGYVMGQSKEPLSFSEAELRRMRTLAGQQAALAVQSQLRFHQIEATLSETAVLYDASQALSAAANEQEIVDAFAGYAMESGAQAVSLFYLETDEAGQPEWAQLVARRILGDVPSLPLGTRFHLPSVSIYQQGVSDPGGLLAINDLETDAGVDDFTREVILQLGNRAMIIMPLRARGRWVGMIAVGWKEPRTFSERDLRIFRALRDQTAITIEGRRLLLQTQDTARREQVLRQITARVRGSLDSDVILRAAVRELGVALGRPTFIRLGSAEELTQQPKSPANGGDGASTSSQGGE